MLTAQYLLYCKIVFTIILSSIAASFEIFIELDGKEQPKLDKINGEVDGKKSVSTKADEKEQPKMDEIDAEADSEKSASKKADENEDILAGNGEEAPKEVKMASDEEEKKAGDDDEIKTSLTISSIHAVATRGFKDKGEVFFVRFNVDTASFNLPNDHADSIGPESVIHATEENRFLIGGTVYFLNKMSRQKFLDGKEFCVSKDGVKVSVLTKEAAAAKKKVKLPGSYPD